MTTARSLKHRTIDHDALAAEVARQTSEVEGMQIATKSQQRLETLEKERLEREQQHTRIRAELEKTRTNIAALQRLEQAQKAAEADISIDLNAIQEGIHALRQSGVTLP